MLVNLTGTTQQKAEAIFSSAKTADTAKVITKLETMSTTEINTWVDKNVTSIAQARALFKKILVVMAYLLNKD